MTGDEHERARRSGERALDLLTAMLVASEAAHAGRSPAQAVSVLDGMARGMTVDEAREVTGSLGAFTVRLLQLMAPVVDPMDLITQAREALRR